ncbi:MAG TPA: hypothetical protein VGE18_01485 [Candidatus Paceibacterota bacterium]
MDSVGKPASTVWGATRGALTTLRRRSISELTSCLNGVIVLMAIIN